MRRTWSSNTYLPDLDYVYQEVRWSAGPLRLFLQSGAMLDPRICGERRMDLDLMKRIDFGQDDVDNVMATLSPSQID